MISMCPLSKEVDMLLLCISETSFLTQTYARPLNKFENSPDCWSHAIIIKEIIVNDYFTLFNYLFLR